GCTRGTDGAVGSRTRRRTCASRRRGSPRDGRTGSAWRAPPRVAPTGRRDERMPSRPGRATRSRATCVSPALPLLDGEEELLARLDAGRRQPVELHETADDVAQVLPRGRDALRQLPERLARAHD